MASVDNIIGRLQFVSSAAPALYLNERLAEELFLTQLGAINAFTRTPGRAAEAAAGAAVIKVGASKDSSQQVTYDLGDPLTKALILHSAMGGQAALTSELYAPPGTFVEVIGTPHLPPHVVGDPPPEAVEAAVERECERQLALRRALGEPDAVYLPLLLKDPRGTVGSVIDRRWIRPTASTYLHPETEVVGFGILERVVDAVPLFTTIYLRPYF